MTRPTKPRPKLDQTTLRHVARELARSERWWREYDKFTANGLMLAIALIGDLARAEKSRGKR